ncbi:MAG: RNA-directed DNA polymerase [Bacteroidetes bacterium]|nr:MAG: RNA-directed DNA polymerase [Bacteroidota bacterium]
MRDRLKGTPDQLREAFLKLRSPRDVAELLDVRYDRLVYHIYVVPEAKRYTVFHIPKKSGGQREILAPATPLKLIQKKLNQVLQAVYQPKPSAHGFLPARNIRTNAEPHAGKRYVLNIDLKDFFPSINFGRVRGLFLSKPYNLPDEVATVLAQIACYTHPEDTWQHNGKVVRRSYLPQGAPTSPIITNMICAGMDAELQRLAKRCRATYTRYADDLTFSTTLRTFPEDLAQVVDDTEGRKRVFLSETLRSIIEKHGFEVNDKKVRLQDRRFRQEVTGLTVNEFPNVRRSFVRQVRAMLHAWDKYGLEQAEREYRVKYESKHRGPYHAAPSFAHIVRGKLEFIGMVKGKGDPVYLKYLGHYYSLIERDKLASK